MSDTTASAKAKDEELVVEKKRAAGAKKQKIQADPSFNMDELRELAELVIEHGFTDFEYENENIRVRLSKMAAPAASTLSQPSAMTSGTTNANATATQSAVAETAAEPATDPDANLEKILSPIVGTFYRSAGPDKEPYVQLGDSVTAETTVCIVEAMKLMNEIQAEVSGEVVKIYVENGQPVEYGQPLFGIRK
jgi:acetyl-CoA carboxylase biotin carboxyl carrier protein